MAFATSNFLAEIESTSAPAATAAAVAPTSAKPSLLAIASVRWLGSRVMSAPDVAASSASSAANALVSKAEARLHRRRLIAASSVARMLARPGSDRGSRRESCEADAAKTSKTDAGESTGTNKRRARGSVLPGRISAAKGAAKEGVGKGLGLARKGVGRVIEKVIEKGDAPDMVPTSAAARECVFSAGLQLLSTLPFTIELQLVVRPDLVRKNGIASVVEELSLHRPAVSAPSAAADGAAPGIAWGEPIVLDPRGALSRCDLNCCEPGLLMRARMRLPLPGERRHGQSTTWTKWSDPIELLPSEDGEGTEEEKAGALEKLAQAAISSDGAIGTGHEVMVH